METFVEPGGWREDSWAPVKEGARAEQAGLQLSIPAPSLQTTQLVIQHSGHGLSHSNFLPSWKERGWGLWPEIHGATIMHSEYSWWVGLRKDTGDSQPLLGNK